MQIFKAAKPTSCWILTLYNLIAFTNHFALCQTKFSKYDVTFQFSFLFNSFCCFYWLVVFICCHWCLFYLFYSFWWDLALLGQTRNPVLPLLASWQQVEPILISRTKKVSLLLTCVQTPICAKPLPSVIKKGIGKCQANYD